MKKVEQNKARKNQLILEAAQAVFLSVGFIQASMDKIAAEAGVTKQTVYRYFPSKTELFHATLVEMGKRDDTGFIEHLQLADTEQALYRFAIDFIRFHTSDLHIATYRLLVAESAAAPEISKIFFSVGPNPTKAALEQFFIERLAVAEPADTIKLWSSMLLGPRNGILVGMKKPSKKQLEQHAVHATDFLLAAIGSKP